MGRVQAALGHRGGVQDSVLVEMKEKFPGELNMLMCKTLTMVPGTKVGGQ